MVLQVFQMQLNLPPIGVLFGGQVLCGKVLVNLDTDKEMRNLRVQIHGRAKTNWTERERIGHRGFGQVGHVGHVRHVGVRHHGDTRAVHYSAEEEYFNWHIYLVGQNDGEMVVLPAGEHEFPFSVTLPVGCPSSFEGDCGSIRYSAKAIIDRPWKFDHESKIVFAVVEYQDLNMDPRARQPIQRHQSKTMGALFWTSGELYATATMPQTGYVPGQKLGLKVTVKSTSHREINSVEAYIRQAVYFTGNRGWATHRRCAKERYVGLVNSQPVPGGGEVRLQSLVDRMDLFNCRPSNLSLHEDNRIQVQLKEHLIDFSELLVPAVPSMLLNCSIIDIYYEVVINLDPAGMHSDLEFGIPIIVGTVPLSNQTNQLNTAGGINPSAPPPGENDTDVVPSAPPQYPDIPPPAYEDCAFGKQNTTEEGDSEHVHGEKEFAPKYPVYKKE